MADNLSRSGAVIQDETVIILNSKFFGHDADSLKKENQQVIGNILQIGIMSFGADQQMNRRFRENIGKDDEVLVVIIYQGGFLPLGNLAKDAAHIV